MGGVGHAVNGVARVAGCGRAAAPGFRFAVEVDAAGVCGGRVRDTRGKHAVFAEASIDHPWIVRDAVAPVVCVVVVVLLAAAGILLRVGVANCERFAV